MPDESKFPTMKLLRCKKCHHVYAANMGGPAECPECSNTGAFEFRPDQEIVQPEKKNTDETVGGKDN
jgi:rubredoxin